MKFKSILFAALCLTIVAACHKHDEDENDKNNPVITLSSPAQDALISGAVTISGTVTDESLHELSIVVARISDGAELFRAEPEVHDLTSYTIAETWTPNVAVETSVALTITAEDHNSNKVSKTIAFSVKP